MRTSARARIEYLCAHLMTYCFYSKCTNYFQWSDVTPLNLLSAARLPFRLDVVFSMPANLAACAQVYSQAA